ncbi:MAG TPA: hypothetical protein VFD36_10440 [Kofleriaceae bacterium]|nr:hypothetical protein [Kofleriaceae bacterium]
MATPPIASQLSEARQQKGMMLEELREAAGLECTADSLCRKLAGKQILTTDEAERLAQALDREIVWTPARRRARRRAA